MDGTKAKCSGDLGLNTCPPVGCCSPVASRLAELRRPERERESLFTLVLAKKWQTRAGQDKVRHSVGRELCGACGRVNA